jgi:hypothetical protein
MRPALNKNRIRHPDPLPSRWAQDLEGSRFVSQQLCMLAAGGSRERPNALQFYARHFDRSGSEQSRRVQTLRWIIPGSRLLLSGRTAKLQSGSPPDVGQTTLLGSGERNGNLI